MLWPFEVDPKYLADHLDEMIDVTVADLLSAVLVLPKGAGFIDYPAFRTGVEVLKRETTRFADFSSSAVLRAVFEDSRVFGVVRAILGMTLPEWAVLARTEARTDIKQGAARTLDRACRVDPLYLREVRRRHFSPLQEPSRRLPEVEVVGVEPVEPRSLLLRQEVWLGLLREGHEVGGVPALGRFHLAPQREQFPSVVGDHFEHREPRLRPTRRRLVGEDLDQAGVDQDRDQIE